MASTGAIRLPKVLAILSFRRSMGGGRRTFPGGLNKWQYKQMHEKLAREKERRLLDEERQLYQARLRLAASGCRSMAFKQHIRALANRFMKAGAEDLWNEDDGPIRSTPDPLGSRDDSESDEGIDTNIKSTKILRVANRGSQKVSRPFPRFSDTSEAESDDE